MISVPGYELSDKVGETKGSIVYHAKRISDKQSVIIKVLNTKYPTPSKIASFKREYDIIKNFNFNGIVKVIDIVEFSGKYALVREDFPGITLKQFCKIQSISIRGFLEIAIALSSALGYLHKKNIIHMDVKPQNVLINPENNEVKLTDFGISAIMTDENEEIYDPDVIRGSLAYMSPEQTGRMNRIVDYRTDLYSLGITFYEVLTGKLPFFSDDPMEIIHAHIAVNPVPPCGLRPDIPQMLSNIIMKLISKTAEERYQNSYGLLSDLQECLHRLNQTREIQPFKLAQQDISLKFNLPQRLYGRDREIDMLISAFERTSQGNVQAMQVAGLPGIGKSALINEIHKPIIAKRGYFLSGKYEEFRQDVPYSAIIQAFKGFINQLLSEKKEMIDRWKQNILGAVSASGKIITDIFPNIQHIIGPQPDVPELGPEESQNRFDFVLINFIKVFATERHPLVLFLDDLQWADMASLQLLRKLLTDPELAYFLLIGSYRNNEAGESHPAVLTFDKLQEAGVRIDTITLDPLNIADVNTLIFEFLKCPEEKSLPLAELIHSKTDGNPFFINHFLKILYEDELLVMDRTEWQWDLNEIEQMQLMENVVDLLADKITKLKDSTRDILKICASIGNLFDLETLSMVLDIPVETVLSRIKDAMVEGYISVKDERYRFNHDRIREAAYSLIPEEERGGIHAKIGWLTLESTDEKDLGNRIFYIVNQLNHGIGRLKEQKQLDKLVHLNYIAGHKAISSAAYSPALKYLETGISLLSKDAWKSQYNLTRDLYKDAMEAACFSGEFDKVDEIFNIAKENIDNVLDISGFSEIRIAMHISQNNPERAVKSGLFILNRLGLRLPKKPGKLHIILELMKIKLAFRGKEVEDILDYPEMTDPKMLAAMDIISRFTTAMYQTNPDLYVLINLKSILISIKYGNAPAIASAYGDYGIILCGVLEDFNTGYRFGRLSTDLLEKLDNRTFKADVTMKFEGFIRHWKEPYKESVNPLFQGYRMGLETGKVEFACYCLFLYGVFHWLSGANLSDVSRSMERHLQIIRQLNQKAPFSYLSLIWQLVLNLTEETENPHLLKGRAYNEEEMLPVHMAANDRSAIFVLHYYKFLVAYFFDEYAIARECIEICRKYIDAGISSVAYPKLPFYYSIILLRLYESASRWEKKIILRKVSASQKKYKKYARSSVINLQSNVYLVEAEKYRVLKNYKVASYYYEKAITIKRESNYTEFEAHAFELAAKFYLEMNQKKTAEFYMKNAHYAYEKWGASAKAKYLEKKYSELISPSLTTTNKSCQDPNVSGTLRIEGAEASLNFSTIMKASQTISQEILLGKLLKKMMWIIIENAGAQKGAIILEKNGAFYVEAEGRIGSKDIPVLKSIPLDSCDSVSASIIYYVSRLKKTLILSNASTEGDFINDSYVTKSKPKSILCIPIITQGRLIGLLYLENNLSTGVFTPNRLEILEILSSQIAISIENARHYANLEQKVQQRTASLKEARDALWGEMELAKKIQTVLLPEKPKIKGYEISAYMDPAEEVGGDYYDIITIDDGKNWIIMGDVSGHGVPAGLIMMMAQTSINTALNHNPDLCPSELLMVVNKTITKNIAKLGESKYMTMTALACLENGRFFFSGLHEDLMVYRAKSKTVESIETQGIWLGVTDNIQGMVSDQELTLNVGDTLLMYTDGITEARRDAFNGNLNVQDTLFGNNRLQLVLKEFGHESPQDIQNAILFALKDYTCNDDVTMLVLKRVR